MMSGIYRKNCCQMVDICPIHYKLLAAVVVVMIALVVVVVETKKMNHIMHSKGLLVLSLYLERSQAI